MKKLIAVAALVVFPMIASAKPTDYGWTTIGRGTRGRIAKELSTQFGGYYPRRSVEGRKGPAGEVRFTAQRWDTYGGNPRLYPSTALAGRCVVGPTKNVKDLRLTYIRR